MDYRQTESNAIPDIYIRDLKRLIEEYTRVEQQFIEISEQKRLKGKLIKNLVEFIKGFHGESKFLESLENAGIRDQAARFLTIEPVTAGHNTVVRRRRGSRSTTPVAPASIVPKGSSIKLLSGKYEGWSGTITTSQARQGPNGLDVTYFLLLKGPGGEARRTSVKHGTLRKSWKTLN